MGQRGRWIETNTLVDEDYVDLPNEEGFKAEPETEWPEDMPWVLPAPEAVDEEE